MGRWLATVVVVLACGCSDKAKDAGTKDPKPAPKVTVDAAPAVAGGEVACNAAAVGGKCVSASCGELAADVTACKEDTDCVVGTFARCECVDPGPFFSVHKDKLTATAPLDDKYAGECDCGCGPTPKPACVAGTCGWTR